MVVRLERFDEVLYTPKYIYIYKSQTKLEEKKMTPCTLLKNIIHTKNPRHGVPRCPQRRPKEFMDHVTNTLVEVVVRDSVKDG